MQVKKYIHKVRLGMRHFIPSRITLRFGFKKWSTPNPTRTILSPELEVYVCSPGGVMSSALGNYFLSRGKNIDLKQQPPPHAPHPPISTNHHCGLFTSLAIRSCRFYLYSVENTNFTDTMIILKEITLPIQAQA